MATTGDSKERVPIEALRKAFEDNSLGHRLFEAGQEPYESSLTSYFSNQERSLTPVYIVKPQTAGEVSATLRTIRQLNEPGGRDVKFAVRSGGHCVWPGAANIDGGITVDLRAINHVTLHADQNEVTIGAGAIWSDVYAVLSKTALTVPGGRVAGVGVGGLVLGGGISYYSPRVGFVCDNVVAYEMVLADGSVQSVTRESHPDLWLALKGGGSNFGIVTAITMRAFAAGDMNGGCYLYPMTHARDFLRAFHDFAADNADENAAAISTYSFRAGHGRHVFNTLTYTQPEADPAPLKRFTDVAAPLYCTRRVTTQQDLAEEQSRLSPPDFQQCYMTTTTALDADMLHALFSIWEAAVPAIESVKGVCWAFGLQVLSPSATRKSAALGGNSLALDQAPPLVVVLLTNFWEDPADSERLVGATRALVGDIEAEARRRGVYHPFKYLNYAWGDQDVFAGYGAESVARMRAAARRYDPDGFFQRGMPGGFKLF